MGEKYANIPRKNVCAYFSGCFSRVLLYIFFFSSFSRWKMESNSEKQTKKTCNNSLWRVFIHFLMRILGSFFPAFPRKGRENEGVCVRVRRLLKWLQLHDSNFCLKLVKNFPHRYFWHESCCRLASSGHHMVAL